MTTEELAKRAISLLQPAFPNDFVAKQVQKSFEPGGALYSEAFNYLQGEDVLYECRVTYFDGFLRKKAFQFLLVSSRQMADDYCALAKRSQAVLIFEDVTAPRSSC